MPDALIKLMKFALALSVLGACDRGQSRSDPPIAVPPAAETAVVATANADAADDPAIWAADTGTRAMLAGRPIEGFIAGTDKKAGLYIYGLDGSQLQFLPDRPLNNVDLSEVASAGGPQVILGASDREAMGIAFFRFDPDSADPDNAVLPAGFVRSDIDRPYGFCMGRWSGHLHGILTGESGAVRIYRLQGFEGAIGGVEIARFSIGSKSEGCVVDEAGGALFVGEEDFGVWRYPIADLGARTLVAQTGAGRLTEDVEGLTIMSDGDRRYLLASSQGDSAFAIWRIDGPAPAYAGRFSVSAKGSVDGVSATDGIDGLSGPVGTYLEGLVVVQDDVNDRQNQNFKLVDWRQIRSALRL